MSYIITGFLKNQGIISSTSEQLIFSAQGVSQITVRLVRVLDCTFTMLITNSEGDSHPLPWEDYIFDENHRFIWERGLIVSPGDRITVEASVANAIRWYVWASGFGLPESEGGDPLPDIAIPEDAKIFYSFDKIYGKILVDEGQGLHPGTISGNLSPIPGITSGKFAASSVNAAGNYTTIPALTGFPWQNTTISFWMRIGDYSLGTGSVLGIGVGTAWADSKRRFWARCNFDSASNGNLVLRWGQGDTGNTKTIALSSLTFKSGQEWMHVLVHTAEYSGNWWDFRTYVGGVDQGVTGVVPGTISTGSEINLIGALVLGATPTNREGYYIGIDQLRIYARQLDLTEIAALAAEGG